MVVVRGIRHDTVAYVLLGLRGISPLGSGPPVPMAFAFRLERLRLVDTRRPVLLDLLATEGLSKELMVRGHVKPLSSC